jgi:opacity protein-like surface antigen
MHKSLFVSAAAVLVMAVPHAAQAQDKAGFFIIGGGYTAPNAEVSDRLGDGYNFVIGGQFNATPVFGIEGLYSFNGLGEKRISVPVFDTPDGGTSTDTDFFGSMNMQYGTIAAVLQRADGGVRPYGLTGLGVYYRPIKVTSPGVGYAPGYCDPWWYVCYPGGFVEVDNIIGERSSTDFGMVFGGGVNFGVFYGEFRYHYIWGPTVDEQTTVNPLITDGQITSERKANGQFGVMTFGLRF